MKRIFLIFILAILLNEHTVLSDSHTVTIRAPAVKKTETGLEGVLSYITVSVQPGSGHVFMDTWPLTQIDMQGSSRLAVGIACEATGHDQNSYDFFITFRSDSPVIGGPSAGGAMTVALVAALQGWKIKDNVMMTGMINPDGSIGPIGGVLEKAQVAHENGVTLFLIPEGQRIVSVAKPQTQTIGPLTIVTSSTEKIDVVEHAQKNWGLEVREVYDITEAVYNFTGEQLPSHERIQASPDTYPMRSYAESEIENASSLMAQTEKSLDSYTGGYKQDFARILAEGDSSLSSAQKNLESKKYFSALSDAFNAEIPIEFAQNLLAYVVSEDTKNISSLLAETETLYKEKRNDTITDSFYGITYLECMATAQLQVGEAEGLIAKAKDAMNGRNYVNAIYSLSMAKQKLNSSSFWARLASTYKTQTVISSTKIQNAADTMMSNAELSYVYASELLGDSEVVRKSGEFVTKSKHEFESGEYAASLFDALQALSYANTSVEMLVSGEEVLQQRLNVARSDAETAIAISRQNGIEPLLASSYFELAETQKDVVSSMAFFKYAKEVGYIFKYLEVTPESTPLTPAPLSPLPESTPPQNPSPVNPSTYTLLLLAALFMGGIVVGFMVRAKYK